MSGGRGMPGMNEMQPGTVTSSRLEACFLLRTSLSLCPCHYPARRETEEWSGAGRGEAMSVERLPSGLALDARLPPGPCFHLMTEKEVVLFPRQTGDREL